MTFLEELKAELKTIRDCSDIVYGGNYFLPYEIKEYEDYVENLENVISYIKETEMTKYQHIFHNIKNTVSYKTVGEDVDYRVFVNDEDEEIILQFEGSKQRADWRHNFMFIPWKLTMDRVSFWTTHGYACAYSSTENKPLEDFIYEIVRHPDYKRIMRGHSFGSAMVKIAARIYTKTAGKVFPLDEVITYGDVKCFLNPFWSIVARKKIGKINEFVTINDIVTWTVPYFWRTKSSRVGDKFSVKKLLKSEWYHMNYETYDYSKYE